MGSRMATLDEFNELLKLVRDAQEGAIQLRMTHLDEAMAFESILTPLHHAADKLTSLLIREL
jgi:hypothetical protein